jgi:hypothetical protein
VRAAKRESFSHSPQKTRFQRASGNGRKQKEKVAKSSAKCDSRRTFALNRAIKLFLTEITRQNHLDETDAGRCAEKAT